MKNEIKKNVQEKINKSDWDLSKFYDAKALVILDKKYEIDVVSKVYPLQKLAYDDLRGRKKGDKSFVFETENNNLGYERADLAFVGDTIMFDGEPRVISEIDKNHGEKGLIMFEDGNVIVLGFTPVEKVDFISELGNFGIKENAETKQEPSKSEAPKATEPTKRIPSTDPSTWDGKFSVGDKVRIRIDFKEFFGTKNDTESVFTIISYKVSSQAKREQNPSGIIYTLSNGNNWEGKDLEIANETTNATNKPKPKANEEPKQTEAPSEYTPVARKSIQEIIKELELVSLFIDTNYFEGRDESTDKISVEDNRLRVSNKRPNAKLELDIDFNYSKAQSGYQLLLYSSIINDGKNAYLDSDTITVDNVPEMVNKLNEKYEFVAKKFNEMLLASVKEELEKEKERQKQKEKEQKEKQEKQKKEKQEKGEKGEKQEGEKEEGEQGEGEQGEGEQVEGEQGEGEQGEGEQGEGEQGEGEQGEGEQGEGEQGEGEQGEGEQGEGEQGEGEQGEGEQGEGEQGEGEQGEGQGQGQGQGEQGEMSSEQLQKLIDELSKGESGAGENSQSSNGNNIDLENFLNAVNQGKTDDNDFGSNYNNQDLKDEIDRGLQSGEENQQPQPQPQSQQQTQEQFFEDYVVTNVLGAMRKILNVSTDDLKRKFPTKKAIQGFVQSLKKSEIDEIANNVGIPKELSNFEKQKNITENLDLELKNI